MDLDLHARPHLHERFPALFPQSSSSHPPTTVPAVPLVKQGETSVQVSRRDFDEIEADARMRRKTEHIKWYEGLNYFLKPIVGNASPVVQLLFNHGYLCIDLFGHGVYGMTSLLCSPEESFEIVRTASHHHFR